MTHSDTDPMSKDAIVDAATITEKRDYDNGFRRQADGDLRESLQQQLESQKFIAKLSSTFVNLPADKVNDAIHSALGEVTEFADADFATLIVCDPVTGKLQHSHQWVAPDFNIEIDFTKIDMQRDAPWVNEILREGNPVPISRRSDLPEEAAKEKIIFDSLGLKSVLLVPFHLKGEVVVGTIAINTLQREISWPSLLIQQLKIIGEVFANALARKQHFEDLQYSLRFEDLLASLSATFINLPSEQIDDKIVAGLHDVGEYVNCDEVFLIQFKSHPAETRITHGWFRFGEQRDLQFDPDKFMELFPWAASHLRQEISVVFGSLDDLPKEAEFELEYLKQAGLSSAVVVPLMLDNKLQALLFAQCLRDHPWPDYLVQQVQLAAQIFFNALQRNASDKKLHVALTEISQLKDHLEAENIPLQHEIEIHSSHEEIIGSSPALKSVLGQAEQVAAQDSIVLIQGETGTGKELVANLIHKMSRRLGKKMIRVNCAALPATLIEAELFGREKGAYTGASSKQIGRFELANHSTLFLDEIGDLPMELQSKLLRVLQEGEFERLGSSQTVKVDVRVIVATNRSLAEQVAAGEFREDLFYRLNVFPIEMPPLRERRTDIPALVWSFVREFGDTMGKSIDKISKNTMKQLQAYEWPGNVRELRNVIERSMILNQNGVLSVQLAKPGGNGNVRPTSQTLTGVETHHIESVLEQTGWRVRGDGGAARILGINPTTLDSRMKKLGIKRLDR